MALKRITLSLSMLVILGTLPAYSAPPRDLRPMGDEVSAAGMETLIFDAVNSIRQRKGLRPLKLSARLRGLARVQSADMAENGYLGHLDSRGRSLEARVRDAGLENWREIGENVARSYGYKRNGDAMVEGWLRSRGHRENILNGVFDLTGIGVVKGNDGYYYATQIFMGSGD